MSVARVPEISSTSEKSFEDASQQGVRRATKTIRNVLGMTPGTNINANMNAGWKSVHPLYGGFDAWQKAGGPLAAK